MSCERCPQEIPHKHLQRLPEGAYEALSRKQTLAAARAVVRRGGLLFSERNQCARKKMYPTEHAALRALKKVEQPELHAYECFYCTNWHVGKRVG